MEDEFKPLVNHYKQKTSNMIYESMLTLWQQRQDEGWTYSDVAGISGLAESRVQQILGYPQNLHIETIGVMVAVLGGDFRIEIYPDPYSDVLKHEKYAMRRKNRLRSKRKCGE